MLEVHAVTQQGKDSGSLGYGATSTFPRCKKSYKPSMTKAPKPIFSFGVSGAKARYPKKQLYLPLGCLTANSIIHWIAH
ncbi:hypothetical protein JOE49_004926 [Paenibacillus sp. PvR133]|nr:hypothetical protein [Paenibacillus sp. PvR133]